MISVKHSNEKLLNMIGGFKTQTNKYTEELHARWYFCAIEGLALLCSAQLKYYLPDQKTVGGGVKQMANLVWLSNKCSG